MVIKVDDLEQQRRLGATGHHPRWAIAYKFAARQATGPVIEDHQSTSTRPVASPRGRQLEPVELAGVDRQQREPAQRAPRCPARTSTSGTSCSSSGPVTSSPTWCRSSRRGDPRAPCPSGARALPGLRRLRLPTRGRGHVALHRQRLPRPSSRGGAAFGSRRAMDIERLSEIVVGQLVDRGLVREITDLYRLDVDALAALARLAARVGAEPARRDPGFAPAPPRPPPERAPHPHGRGARRSVPGVTLRPHGAADGRPRRTSPRYGLGPAVAGGGPLLRRRVEPSHRRAAPRRRGAGQRG